VPYPRSFLCYTHVFLEVVESITAKAHRKIYLPLKSMSVSTNGHGTRVIANHTIRLDHT
jgi:hypothetical protein